LLVLNRRRGESVIIDLDREALVELLGKLNGRDDVARITVTVVSRRRKKGGQASLLKLGFDAPQCVDIYREELGEDVVGAAD
jgi:sRNA-binding carbon storage regulator CsrA